MTLDSGTQKLFVAGITEYAQEDSFRVKGSGPASLSAIDVRRTVSTYEPKSDLKPLLDELKKLISEREATADEIAIYSGRLSYLEAMNAAFAGNFGLLFAASEAEISQLTEMDAVSGRNTVETKGKIRELEKKLKDIDEKIDLVKKNLGRIESEKKTEGFYEVEITVDVTKRAQVELEVTYQVSNTGWRPSYDLDLLSSSAKLRRVSSSQQSDTRTLGEGEPHSFDCNCAAGRGSRSQSTLPYSI